MFTDLGIGMWLRLDANCPRPIQVKFPPKGPYWQRRQKKWAQNVRNYNDPEVYLDKARNTIMCHPMVWEKWKHEIHYYCKNNSDLGRKLTR